MAISKPRILYDSIPFKASLIGGVWSPTEGTTDLGTAAVNWRPGEVWTPTWHEQILGNGSDATVNPFLTWPTPTAAPTGWLTFGAGLTIARDSSNFYSGTGPYGAALTRAGTDCFLYYELPNPTTYKRLKLSFGCWCKSSIANTVRIRLQADSIPLANSSYHTGGGGWEWLSVTATVTATVTTQVAATLAVLTSNQTAYFSAPYAVLGPDITQTPHPDTAYLYCYPVDGQLLNGWFFNAWTNGPAAAPDSWTLTGASAVTYRTMANSPKVGWNAAGVTRAGTDCYLYQNLTAQNLQKVLGKYVSAGAWARATVASRAYVEIAVTHRDNATVEVFSSSAHTGGSSYEWLEKEAVYVPHDAVAVSVRLSVKTGDTSVEFSGALLVQASTVAQTPHSKSATAFAVADHNLGTTGRGIALQSSSDNATYSDVVAEVSPSTDHALWRDFGSASAAYWRVKITAAAGEGQPSIGVIAFGTYLELPYYLPAGWDPYQRKVRGLASESNNGNPLGRSMLKVPRRLQIIQEYITEAELETLQPWLSVAGGDHFTTAGTGRGLPFFLQWDDGDHESWSADDKDGGPFLCWIPSGNDVHAPLQFGIRADRVEVTVEAVNR